MPEFFVPPGRGGARNDEWWWQNARQRAEEAGFRCGRRRIFQLVAGGEVVAEVGQLADMGGGGVRKEVGAIFDALESYVIYAIADGSMRSVSKADVEAVDFK